MHFIDMIMQKELHTLFSCMPKIKSNSPKLEELLNRQPDIIIITSTSTRRIEKSVN